VTGLDRSERNDLLRLARASLEQRLLQNGALDRELERTRLTPSLEAPGGAFVTLKLRGDGSAETLRGCIGTMSSSEPLHRTVTGLIVKSALEDPRFPPVTADDLVRLRIEISVLSPLRDVAGAQEIEIGRHGVQLTRGSAGAVFLPQVAVEHGWDVDQLLRQLARKAGLKETDWRDGRLSVFEAQVFGEPTTER